MTERQRIDQSTSDQQEPDAQDVTEQQEPIVPSATEQVYDHTLLDGFRFRGTKREAAALNREFVKNNKDSCDGW